MLIRVCFRLLLGLMLFLIVVIMGVAGWEAFILGHHWEAMKMILFLIAAVILIGFGQQYLLWLLPKADQ